MTKSSEIKDDSLTFLDDPTPTGKVYSSKDLKLFFTSQADLVFDKIIKIEYMYFGTIKNILYVSETGKTWKQSKNEEQLIDIKYFRGGFIALTLGNKLIRSADGIYWDTFYDKFDKTVNCFEFTGENYIVAGNQGQLFVSMNASADEWGMAFSGNAGYNFNKLFYYNSTVFAFNQENTLFIKSQDGGITWETVFNTNLGNYISHYEFNRNNGELYLMGNYNQGQNSYFYALNLNKVEAPRATLANTWLYLNDWIITETEIIVLHSGTTILLSSDKGKTFKLVYFNPNASFKSGVADSGKYWFYSTK
jgi:hypothetical protein